MIQGVIAVVSSYAFPLTALVISLGALLYSGLSLRRQESSDTIAHLYNRIDDLEGQIATLEAHTDKYEKRCAELERKVEDLQSENWRLMRRLLKVEHDEPED